MRTLLGLQKGFHWRDTISMRPEPNHIRNWHHSQPKTLRLARVPDKRVPLRRTAVQKMAEK